MEESKIKKIYEILNSISITSENENVIEEIKEELLNKDYIEALNKIEKLNQMQKEEKTEKENQKQEKKKEEEEGKYPKKLSNKELEQTYMGLLLSEPK